jgi:membrane-bound lytic murein transglycosylase D
VEPTPLARRKSYRVKRSETLSQVARKLGLSVSELKRMNRIKGSKLRKGQTLVYFKLENAPKKWKQSTHRKHKKKAKKRRKRR